MKKSEVFTGFESYLKNLQQKICSVIEAEDRRQFCSDEWKKSGAGGGITRVIEKGNLIEKGGVNFSSVSGNIADSVTEFPGTKSGRFNVCGLSLIIHPVSPKIPTIHMNLRYFELDNGDNWIGGGIDLTPYFPYPEDFIIFHQMLEKICDQHIPGSYRGFKKACDEYFTIPHRKEMRGIGGVFFDYLRADVQNRFEFARSMGDNFTNIYQPIIQLRKKEKFTGADRKFQLIRRGRYVEFNLLYDRGTRFGLKSAGRTESILISLPATVQFPYNWTPEPNTPQAEMMRYYQPFDWINYRF